MSSYVFVAYGHIDRVDPAPQVCVEPLTILVQNAKQEGDQILKTVVWIERWMGVSVLRGGVVTRTSGTKVSGRRETGHTLARWNVAAVLVEETCECGPISKNASHIPRVGSSIPEEHSIAVDCDNGRTQA